MWVITQRADEAVLALLPSLPEVRAWMKAQAGSQKLVERPVADGVQFIVKDHATHGAAGLQALMNARIYLAREVSDDEGRITPPDSEG